MPYPRHKNYTAPPEPLRPAIQTVLYYFGGKVQLGAPCHCWECCPGCLDCPGLRATEDGYLEPAEREEKTVKLAHLFGGRDE